MDNSSCWIGHRAIGSCSHSNGTVSSLKFSEAGVCLLSVSISRKRRSYLQYSLNSEADLSLAGCELSCSALKGKHQELMANCEYCLRLWWRRLGSWGAGEGDDVVFWIYVQHRKINLMPVWSSWFFYDLLIDSSILDLLPFLTDGTIVLRWWHIVLDHFIAFN